MSKSECKQPYCVVCKVRIKPSYFMTKIAAQLGGTGHLQCDGCGSYYEYTYEDGCLVYFEKCTEGRLLLKGQHVRDEEQAQ